MAENLPIHMSDDEKEVVDNKSDVSALSDNEEKIEYEKEIEYESVSETSLDCDFNEEDGKFQVPLIVLQQLLIPSRQQPRSHPHLFYVNRDQAR